MDLPDDDFLLGEIKELRQTLSAPEYETERRGRGRRAEDHDWRRWLAKRGPILVSICSVLLMVIGGLGGQIVSNELSDKEAFRKGLEDMRIWVQNIDGRVQSVEQALPRYGDDAAYGRRLMEDMARENLTFWKAQAEDRGDHRTAARLERKLRQLPPTEASPPPSQ